MVVDHHRGLIQGSLIVHVDRGVAVVATDHYGSLLGCGVVRVALVPDLQPMNGRGVLPNGGQDWHHNSRRGRGRKGVSLLLSLRLEIEQLVTAAVVAGAGRGRTGSDCGHVRYGHQR